MKFDQEVICQFCLGVVSGRVALRIPKLARKHIVGALESHRPTCPRWNERAWQAGLRV